MARGKFLPIVKPVLAIATLVALTTHLVLSGDGTKVCGPSTEVFNTCSSLHHDSLDISADLTTPEDGPTGGAESPRPSASRPDNAQVGVGVDGGVEVGAPIIRDDITVVGPATIEDLINFRPNPGIARMEPTGWMLVGLPTNFWIDSSPETQSGLLLDREALVRFTPVSYRFDYGDGTVASRSTPGGSWAELDAAEFDQTVFSHVYSRAGRYVIDAQVSFGVEYQYAGGNWITMDGSIVSASGRLEAVAGTASTVLVSSDCVQKPAAIGC